MKYFFSKLIHFIKNLVEIHKCFGQGWVLKVHQGQGRRSAGRSLISVTRSLPRLPPRSNMRAMRVNYGPCRLSSHPNFHEIDLSLGDPWPMPRIASRPFCSNFNWFSWLTQNGLNEMMNLREHLSTRLASYSTTAVDGQFIKSNLPAK